MIPWTSDIAYAIGLITTDGNLSKDRRHISLTSSDEQLLQTFKRCLHLENRIGPAGGKSKKQCYKVTFGSTRFYNQLLKIGLMPNKTFNLSSMKIPKRYFADFLRGHMDGDGSIIHYVDKHNKYKEKIYTYDRLYITFRSASFPHIKWIRQCIKNALGINGSLSGWKSRKNDNRKVMWTLRFCKTDSLVLLKYLYYKKYLPCLQREKNIASSF
ncbi:MAG: LAGLIDADG family homing endonuclease, partial [Candidatus Omnitrophica bacterium]|nr:LAGLIDADG family homing endonuclease [Candidatus Omnitrophota bacterium]